jgi:hypothetical protein
MYVLRCRNLFPNHGLNTSMNTQHVCCSIIPLSSHIINNYAEILKTSNSGKYSPVVSLALTKQRNPSRRMTISPVHATNLHPWRLVHVLKQQLVHRQLNQCIQSLYTLYNFFTYHFIVNFDYLNLYIWRRVLYPQIRYWVIQVRHMMQNCHEIMFVFGMPSTPNCNILTTAKNKYNDYLLQP